MEEYFPSDRLLELEIDSVVHIDSEDGCYHFTVRLVGVDNERSVVTTLPQPQYLPENMGYAEVFPIGYMLEMRTIYEGKVIAFETAVTGMYGERLLISTFPEMIEARRLRRDIRFPCAVSCDIRGGNQESFGVITNVSHGGCQVNVPRNNDFGFIERAIESQDALDIEVFFPYSDHSATLKVNVKSVECQIDGTCKVGMAFCYQYEVIRKYLESLQLDSVAPFFF